MSNFVLERIKSIIFYPSYEWKIIAAEKRSLKEDFIGYGMVLIIAGAASQAIGSFFFVRNVLDIDAYRFSFPLVKALLYIIRQVLVIFLLTFFIHGTARKFVSEKDFVKSGKLAINGLTPYFLCYILYNLNHQLLLAMIPAIYSLFVIAKGLPVMLKTAPLKIASFVFLIALMVLGSTYIMDIGLQWVTSLLFPDIVSK